MNTLTKEQEEQYDTIQKTLFEMRGPDNRLLRPGEDSFQFSCKACGQCCFNREGQNTIMLSPYDIYRLIKFYSKEGQTQEAFVEKHIEIYIGNNSGLPIAKIKTKELFDSKTICSFLKKDVQKNTYKCTVHQHKPSACRLFPLGRLASSSAKEKEDAINTFYFLQTDIGCGDNSNIAETHTLDEWIPDRLETEKALKLFATFQGKLYRIIDLKAVRESEKLSAHSLDLFYNAFTGLLYFNWNPDKTFEEQFIQKETALLEMAKIFLECFKGKDKTILSKLN